MQFSANWVNAFSTCIKVTRFVLFSPRQYHIRTVIVMKVTKNGDFMFLFIFFWVKDLLKLIRFQFMICYEMNGSESVRKKNTLS